ncbi:MAG: hypothetical protein JJU02_00890 [Cryomorphaceae bacterium]|nr:hypothetical protein [Cryomorphaceae bacterium]
MPKPTPVFDLYWYFAAERQNIFLKKLKGEKSPWTNDEILDKYKFTNSYRALDRVSQFLINEVVYKNEYPLEDTYFRIILFKLFNKIETWKALEQEFGEITLSSYSFDKFSSFLNELMENKFSIYSAAYIMASGGSYYKYKRKHQNHLKLLEHMIQDEVPRKLNKSSSMEEGYKILLSYPSVGTFLAYQLITDINYSEITNYSEMEFVKAGPGAIEGISKCFSNYSDFSAEDIIRMVTAEQDYHFERLNIQFDDLFGRKLQLIDCQNIFCEIGKYARVSHPEIKGVSTRFRIKQKYKETNKNKVKLFLPPKWNLELNTIGHV